MKTGVLKIIIITTEINGRCVQRGRGKKCDGVEVRRWDESAGANGVSVSDRPALGGLTREDHSHIVTSATTPSTAYDPCGSQSIVATVAPVIIHSASLWLRVAVSISLSFTTLNFTTTKHPVWTNILQLCKTKINEILNFKNWKLKKMQI